MGGIQGDNTHGEDPHDSGIGSRQLVKCAGHNKDKAHVSAVCEKTLVKNTMDFALEGNTIVGKNTDKSRDVEHLKCDKNLVKPLVKTVENKCNNFMSPTLAESCGKSNATMQSVHKNFSQDSCNTVCFQNRQVYSSKEFHLPEGHVSIYVHKTSKEQQPIGVGFSRPRGEHFSDPSHFLPQNCTSQQYLQVVSDIINYGVPNYKGCRIA